MNTRGYMNTGKTSLIVIIIAGILLGAGAVFFLLRPSRPIILELRCDVQTNVSLNISKFMVKILDTNVKERDIQTRTARLQWRCEVKNLSNIALRYTLKAELLDKDRFILATGIVDSDIDQGDLPPGQIHTVSENILLDYSRVKHLTSALITPGAFKTNSQIQQEQNELRNARIGQQRIQQAKADQELAQRTLEAARQSEAKMKKLDEELKASRLKHEQQIQEKLQQKQLARAEQEKQINKAREKWKGLKIGMSKTQVQALLGKPLNVRSIGSYQPLVTWEYPEIEGSYTTPRVEFGGDGLVQGWRAPSAPWYK